MRFPITIWLADARHDVHLDLPGTARIRGLAEAVAEHLGVPGPVTLALGGVTLSPDGTVVESGIRAGSSVQASTADGAGTRRGGRPLRRIRVVDGPDVGLTVPLPVTGAVTIGRSADNEIRLTAPAVSRRHASLLCDAGLVRITDTGSSHGTLLADDRVREPVTVADGVPIQIGADRLVVEAAPADAAPSGAHLTKLPDGRVRFARPHRYATPPSPLVTDAPPAAPEASKASLPVGIGAASGLLLGVVGYLFSHNLSFLVFSLVSTLTLVATGLHAWWQARGDRSRAGRAYRSAAAAHEAAVASLAATDREQRLAASPGVTEVLDTVERAGTTLWERRPLHEDFLRVRLGLASLPSAVQIQGAGNPAAQPAPVLHGVPLTVDLASAGTVGISGPHAPARALARWVLAQAVTQSGPADLSVAVLTSVADEPAGAWDWVRWLPHARPASGPYARIGNDAATLRTVIDELAAVVATRRQAVAEVGPGSRRFAQHWLVVVDDLSEHDVPGLADILTTGPDVGVHVVAIGRLPYRCPVTVTFTDAAVLDVRGPAGQTADVRADLLNAAVGERLGRALAPLADAEQRAGQAVLPTQVALLDLVPAADPQALLRRWDRRVRDSRTVIGAGPDGPVTVDIAESGPHLLVAGATGWGKSELLRCLVAGLAVANRPDQLGLILVDFKGGAAFQAFAGLPHTVDTITNLDGQQVMRALDSLAGEMNRRQRYLAMVGADKLEDYHRLADAGTLPPGCPATLPRLLVVIDEFAKLRDELPPDILTRLVHVATQGRSLGLHLIIGTQTPRGSVPADIRPNVNLHVALHLTAEHSQDVIGVPDAAGLSVKGRAYLRRGEEAELTPFQSAYLGGTRTSGGPTVRVLPAPWHRLGYPPAPVGGATVRDIDLLVGAVRQAATEARLAGPARPWLPELPQVVAFPSLADPAATVAHHGPLKLAYGREDHPERRAQPVAVWDLSSGTNLLAAGQPKSGRTTLLRTLAVSAADHPTERIQLYVMDCGGDLADLAELPHCGAVVGAGDLYRAARLLDHLERLTEQRDANGAGGRPHTVVMIDDWDTWLQTIGELDSGNRYDQLVRIARKGAAARVHLAVTGSSTLLSGGRARPLIETALDRLALPFDRADYGFLGVPSTSVPSSRRPGLAVRMDEPHRIVQVAVPGTDPLPAAQTAAVRSAAASARDRATGQRPAPIEALPERLSRAEVRARATAVPPATWVTAGLGGDALAPVGVDLEAQGPGLVVTGEPRSGRSTALLNMALDLIASGLTVVGFAPGRSSPLRRLAGVPGVAAVLHVPSPTLRHAQLAIAAAGSARHVLVVDDADLLMRTDVDAVLRDRLRAGDRRTVGAVFAASAESMAGPPPGTFLGDAARGAAVLVLGARAARVPLLGSVVRLSDAYVGSTVPGRGVFVVGGEQTPVQVPAVEPAEIRAGSVPRALAILQVTEALAGAASTFADLTAIVDELRAAGFDDLDEALAARAVALAAGWSGTPGELVATATG